MERLLSLTTVLGGEEELNNRSSDQMAILRKDQ